MCLDFLTHQTLNDRAEVGQLTRVTGGPEKELAADGGIMKYGEMRKILLPAVMLCLLTVPLVAMAQEDSEAAQVKDLDFKLTEAYKERKFVCWLPCWTKIS